MRLVFQVRFHTHYGQSLLLTGNHEIFGDGDIEKGIPLQYLNEQSWQVMFVIPRVALPDDDIVYNYVLRDADGTITYDWGRNKVINLASFQDDEVLIVDAWNNAGFYENAFYTE